MTVFVPLALAICLIALASVSIPLWRSGQRALTAWLLVAGCTIGMGSYFLSSNFDFDRPSSPPTFDEMLLRLEQRLQREPDDVDGWRMLGRSNMQLGRYTQAVGAYARAYELSQQDDPMIMLDYAEAMISENQTNMSGAAGQLIENALKLAPADPRALWYAGLAAASRGDGLLAADRWEMMLSPETPADVREILESRIAALRGEPAPVRKPAETRGGATSIVASVSVSEALAARVDPSATLYLIASAPEGGPPLAVVRQPAGSIPDRIEISDGDAMIPGRDLSSQPKIRLTARISQSGQPIAQTGDIFGETELTLPVESPVSLTIDKLVSD